MSTGTVSRWALRLAFVIIVVVSLAALFYFGEHEPRSELSRLDELANREAEAVHRQLHEIPATHLSPTEMTELANLCNRYHVKLVSMATVRNIVAQRADFLRRQATFVATDSNDSSQPPF